MPYTLDTAPAAIEALPAGAKRIWVSAFNSALAQYDDEGRASATAWAAVKNKYRKTGDKWMLKKRQRMARHVLYENETLTVVRLDKESKDLDAQTSKIRSAFYDKYQAAQIVASPRDMWVERVFDDAVIARDGDSLFRIEYTEDADGMVAFGEPAEVEIEYKPIAKSVRVGFVKADDDKHLVYGVVMEPDATDTEGDATTADEIEKAAHGFMLDYQNLDLQHERVLEKGEASIVESYIAPSDLTLGETLVTKGCWIMVTKVFAEEVWKAVKSGEITGYSIVGWGIRKPAEGN